MNRHVSSDSAPVRGISATERSARIRNNPLRAAAIVKGRQRLAKVAEQLTPGLRPLSALRCLSIWRVDGRGERWRVKT